MKTINLITFLFFILILLFGNASFSQSEKFNYNGNSIELDKKLIKHYGLEYISVLKINDPDLLLYLNYFVANAYVIEDIGIKISDIEIQNINSLNISEKSKASAFNSSDYTSFNILAYNIQLKPEQQVFKINSGSNAIVVFSKQYFLDKYNAYRNAILNNLK
jgi:hypothetical protein